MPKELAIVLSAKFHEVVCDKNRLNKAFESLKYIHNRTINDNKKRRH